MNHYCKTFAIRTAIYEAEMQQYEALGYRHTGRMTKDKQGLEKGIYRYNPEAPKIWSKNKLGRQNGKF